MNTLKGLLLIIAISAMVCHDNIEEPKPLFDLAHMFETGTLQAFLADVKEGVPVNVEDCTAEDVKPIFKAMQKKVTPDKIAKGEKMKIKVQGMMTEEQTVAKLMIDTYFNHSPKPIDTRYDDKKNVVVKKGSWIWEYEASVPTFTPSGPWEIYMFLINKDGQKISCTKATFNMS